MDKPVSWVPFDQMERFVRDVFVGLGVPPDESAICADVLITADKRGIDSHGVARLKTIYYDRIARDKILSPITQFDVVRDVKATAVVDGHQGMGMVISHRAMNLAIQKARTHGIGMVTVRNSSLGISPANSLLRRI